MSDESHNCADHPENLTYRNCPDEIAHRLSIPGYKKLIALRRRVELRIRVNEERKTT